MVFTMRPLLMKIAGNQKKTKNKAVKKKKKKQQQADGRSRQDVYTTTYYYHYYYYYYYYYYSSAGRQWRRLDSLSGRGRMGRRRKTRIYYCVVTANKSHLIITTVGDMTGAIRD
jgi:hypothetical protein